MNKDSGKLCGVYNLEGIKGKSCVKIIPVGSIELKAHEHIADKLIVTHEVSKGVCAEFYACNILDSFLISTKLLPMMYVKIILDKPLRRIFLYRINVYFNILSDIKDSKDLINNEIEGEFKCELVLNDIESVLNNINLRRFTSTERLVEKLMAYIKSQESSENIQKIIAREDEIQKQKCIEEYGQFAIPRRIISLRNYDFKNKNNNIRENKNISESVILE